MKCPKCGSPLEAITEVHDSDKSVTRIRKCFVCGNKFMTVETIKTAERRTIK